uniref:Uncharacterized protein n=1 Tax=Aegilops tauschii subsp. strangulata TaxID=200361 RepID=A0A453KCB4_AEGTS
SSSVLVSQKTMVYYSKTCKIHDERKRHVACKCQVYATWDPEMVLTREEGPFWSTDKIGVRRQLGSICSVESVACVSWQAESATSYPSQPCHLEWPQMAHLPTSFSRQLRVSKKVQPGRQQAAGLEIRLEFTETVQQYASNFFLRLILTKHTGTNFAEISERNSWICCF